MVESEQEVHLDLALLARELGEAVGEDRLEGGGDPRRQRHRGRSSELSPQPHP